MYKNYIRSIYLTLFIVMCSSHAFAVKNQCNTPGRTVHDKKFSGVAKNCGTSPGGTCQGYVSGDCLGPGNCATNFPNADPTGRHTGEYLCCCER